jgi:hypothetical protein
MNCPSCKIETQIQEQKTEYIYPNALLGMPTFWGFMTPAVARLVTIVIASIGIILAYIGIGLLLSGSIIIAIPPLLLCLFTIYTVIVCIYSIDKYKIKKYYKCLSCRLEWYGDTER